MVDEGAYAAEDLPRRNLVSALIGLETSRSPDDAVRVIDALIEWVEGPGEQEVRRAFEEWIARVLVPRRFGAEGEHLVRPLEEVRTMLEERVREWARPWLEEGREQGIARGRAEERHLLRRLAARKFGNETAGRLSVLLDALTSAEPLAEVGEWIIDCDTGEDLIERTERMIPRS